MQSNRVQGVFTELSTSVPVSFNTEFMRKKTEVDCKKPEVMAYNWERERFALRYFQLFTLNAGELRIVESHRNAKDTLVNSLDEAQHMMNVNTFER